MYQLVMQSVNQVAMEVPGRGLFVLKTSRLVDDVHQDYRKVVIKCFGSKNTLKKKDVKDAAAAGQVMEVKQQVYNKIMKELAITSKGGNWTLKTLVGPGGAGAGAAAASSSADTSGT